jgi:hypothetical protein
MRELGLIFLRHVLKLDTVPELRMVGYDHSLGRQSMVLDPENEIQLGSHWQREGHFHVASNKAKIGSFGVAGDGCALRLEFKRNPDLGAWESPALPVGSVMRLFGHGFVSFPNQDASECNGACYREERKD